MNLKEVENISNTYKKSIISELRKVKITESLKNKKVEILWNLAFRDNNSDSKIPVRCLVDGEYSIYFTSHLARGIICCDHCLTNKHSELFHAKGFKYLTKTSVEGVGINLGECLKCKTVVKVTTGNLHGKYNVICPTCDHKRITDVLALKQCEYVSTKLVNYIQRITYKNINGDLFENSQSNILRGNFTSGGSHWKQQHSLYLITCKFNDVFYFKIGTANNPNQRLSILKLLGETSVITLEKFDTRYAASKQEKHLHKLFKCSNLDKEVAKLFTTGYSKLGKKAGITEWFTEDILPELKQIYKLKDN
jgi:hypothetical protein